MFSGESYRHRSSSGAATASSCTCRARAVCLLERGRRGGGWQGRPREEEGEREGTVPAAACLSLFWGSASPGVFRKAGGCVLCCPCCGRTNQPTSQAASVVVSACIVCAGGSAVGNEKERRLVSSLAALLWGGGASRAGVACGVLGFRGSGGREGRRRAWSVSGRKEERRLLLGCRRRR